MKIKFAKTVKKNCEKKREKDGRMGSIPSNSAILAKLCVLLPPSPLFTYNKLKTAIHTYIKTMLN